MTRAPSLGSSAMRDRRSQVTIAAVAFLLGVLVVVQLRTQTGGSALQNKSAQDLTTLVGSLNTRNDQLRGEVGSLQGQLDELRADKANGATSVEQIQAELGRIRAWSGLDPVAGRGVTIVVNGAIGGDGVGELLNELRNAGAEAIAVESVRVVPGTTVGGDPGSLESGRRSATVRDPGDWQAGHARRLPDPGGRDRRPARARRIRPRRSTSAAREPMTLPATGPRSSPSHGHPSL